MTHAHTTQAIAGVVAAGVVLAAAGVADASVRIRGVHASPDAPTVDILVDDAIAFPAVSFPSATGYATLPNGTYDVDLQVTADPSVDLEFGPPVGLADNDYTLVALNTLASIEPRLFVDDNTVDPEQSRVRFIHASPDAPTVDVRLAGGGLTLFDDVEFTESGGYQTVAPGTYDLEVTNADQSQVFLPLSGIELRPGFVYTVFAVGFAAPPTVDDPGLDALLAVDVPAPGAAGVLALAGIAAARRRR